MERQKSTTENMIPTVYDEKFWQDPVLPVARSAGLPKVNHFDLFTKLTDVRRPNAPTRESRLCSHQILRGEKPCLPVFASNSQATIVFNIENGHPFAFKTLFIYNRPAKLVKLAEIC